MKWFINLKLSKKLLVMFSYVTFLALIIGVYGVLSLLRLGGNSADVRMAVYIMIGIIIIIMPSSIAIGIYMARILGEPLQKYSKAIDLLSTGDINMDAVFGQEDMSLRYRKDEIGTLGNALHKLISATKKQVKAIQEISSGNLTINIDARSENDLLGKALIALIDHLNELVNSIAVASEQVASGSNLVSDSSTELSLGATEQASAVEELTSSLEGISSQTDQNAKNAGKANEMTISAKTYAEAGNTQMQELLRSMDQISESSRNISSIIKVIDDIAFQTNILALNAAVEAARAGQHGKGFAVVAEEVRNLAAKSANATKETAALIEGSMQNVQTGSEVADETAQTLRKIVEAVERAASLVSDIAFSSQEQAAAIEQVNQGIVQVSHVVQTNAATSEESAAASQELLSQAAQLVDHIKIFKLKNGTTSFMTVNQNKTIPKAGLTKTTPELSPQALPRKSKIILGDGDFGKY